MSLSSILNETVKSFSKFFCKLPEKDAAALAVSIGLITWNTWKSERNRLEDCIDRVYYRLNRKPPFPVKLIVKKAFIHFALVASEILRYPAVNKEYWEKHFKLNGHENVKKALSNGKGVIMALPHIGNWEYFGGSIVNAGYTLNSFFLAQKEDEIGSLLDYFRGFSGITLHDRDRGGAKALKALRNNECLGMITDQDGNANGVYMDFLGHWVSMPAGPANWSIKTGAALLPVYSLRKGYTYDYDAFFLPAIDDCEGSTKEEKTISRTVKLAKWMEELILTYPHQYLWFYDRFKPRHEAWVTNEININGQMCHGSQRYGK
ncbi:MAG: lysophospholipid acyltransferase family protein [Candidatus Riflebacteria bacterium]|nr:lysophospholipid acyltransferase family protein [Candidatus Riflebacteria bacterium]